MSKLLFAVFTAIGAVVCFMATEYNLAIFFTLITIILIYLMRRGKNNDRNTYPPRTR